MDPEIQEYFDIIEKSGEMRLKKSLKGGPDIFNFYVVAFDNPEDDPDYVPGTPSLPRGEFTNDIILTGYIISNWRK